VAAGGSSSPKNVRLVLKTFMALEFAVSCGGELLVWLCTLKRILFYLYCDLPFEVPALWIFSEFWKEIFIF